MTDKKNQTIKKSIEAYILKDFNFKMDEVLSWCESEIEKLYVLHLYNYFQTFRSSKELWFNEFGGLEFTEDEIVEHDEYSKEEKAQFIQVKDYAVKNNYRRYSGRFYRKYNGFKVKSSYMESWAVLKEGDKMLRQEFEVYPQYKVRTDELDYRVDIAVILNRLSEDNKVIESRKIAIECDGYDYHSSPVQKKNDDIRARKLKKSGWKEVLRYSGTELYNIKDSEEVHNKFKEIIEILYV